MSTTNGVTTEIKEVTCFTSSYSDWKGTVEEWRSAFFNLLSHKNTFDGFYELTVLSYSDHIPYLYMVIDNDELNAERVFELLQELGYKNIDRHASLARVIDAVWTDAWDEDADCGIWHYYIG